MHFMLFAQTIFTKCHAVLTFYNQYVCKMSCLADKMIKSDERNEQLFMKLFWQNQYHFSMEIAKN